MNTVKFNKETKEIEIKGSKSFIESHYDIIGIFPIKSSGARNIKGSAQTRAHWKVVPTIDKVERRKPKTIETQGVIDIPPAVQETSLTESRPTQEPKTKRPPVRKYFNTSGKLIRSEEASASGEMIEKNVVSDAIENIPKGMSISALKEKFGLSEDKVKAIIEEAEKQGKVRRDMDGSFVWCNSDEEM